MIEIKQYISEVIHAGLAKLEIKENVLVEKSANSDFGDFSSNIAMALAKTLRENPLKIAKMIQSELIIDKKIICFCVGSATEKKARSCGFQNVLSADGNVNNLKELILQNYNSSNGKLLYVSGEIISNDLDQHLISEGYNVKRIVNYSAKPVEKFNEVFIEKLKLKMPEIVYVYSQNSAISFLNLIKNYQLVDHWMDTNLMCIGEKTSMVLNEIKWKKIFLFNPGEEEFLLYKI